MILPAVRERLEAVLRHAAMEGALAALRSGASHISITGLHDVAKALVASYLTRELRRPAFFVTDSNRRAEALAETLRFFSGIFPGAVGGVATLPAFDRLPWESQSPHADILERRAATLFRECPRSEEHTSELQSRRDLVCRLLLQKKKKRTPTNQHPPAVFLQRAPPPQPPALSA